MLNQRGQAFSVFELLIAAIVAVAILFVLLPIVTNIVLPTGDAVKEIGNTISSNSNTALLTKPFVIGPGQPIRTEVFANKGVDPCAVYFDTSSFGDGDSGQIYAVVDSEPDGAMQCTSKIINRTNSEVRAQALVVCASTPSSLESTLQDVRNPDAYNEDLWDDPENVDYTKVCAVIVKRA